jgi:hypothetical protein
VTVPMWSPFALLAVACALPSRAALRRIDWPVVAMLVYCVGVWAVVGADRLVASPVNDCGCRKGAIRPDCERHDPGRLDAGGRFRQMLMRDVVAWRKAQS